MAGLGYLAALDDQDKNKQNQNNNQNIVGGSSAGYVNTSAPPSGGDVGPGGVGAWTNIQAYLNANKQDTGTAKYVQDKVNPAFQTESSNLSKTSTDAKTAAQRQVNNVNDVSKNADPMIRQAASAYQWSQPVQTNQDYTQNVSKLKSAINDKYSGPQDYTYNFGADAQKYGDTLSNNDAFTQFLDNSYAERAGKPLNAGQLALQKQLDTTNDNLVSTRADLLKKYQDLNSERENTITNTDAEIQKAQNDYVKSQNALADMLRGFQSNETNDIINAQNAANKYYEQRMQSTRSDIESGLLRNPPKDLLDQERNYLDYINRNAGVDSRRNWNVINDIIGAGGGQKRFYRASTGENLDFLPEASLPTYTTPKQAYNDETTPGLAPGGTSSTPAERAEERRDDLRIAGPIKEPIKKRPKDLASLQASLREIPKWSSTGGNK